MEICPKTADQFQFKDSNESRIENSLQKCHDITLKKSMKMVEIFCNKYFLYKKVEKEEEECLFNYITIQYNNRGSLSFEHKRVILI